MKKILLLTLAVFGVFTAASAQYFCTEKGKTMFFKETTNVDKTTNEFMVKSTVLDVTTDADGTVSAVIETTEPIPDNPLGEVKTQSDYYYNPQTDITKIVMMSGENFKKFVMDMIKESFAANGRYMSENEIADLEKAITTKGAAEIEINPAAAPETKIANSTLRLSAGQMTMNMNIWDAKFLGAESITVEAGTFDCVKISYTQRMSTPNENIKKFYTDWYAKGVGLVRSIETDKKGNIVTEQELRLIK